MEFSRASLEDLIALLDLPDMDYWSDVGSCDARAILDRAGEPLLQKVLEELMSWPRLRQEHLAYILGEPSATFEIEILTLLARSRNPEVAIAARESLAGIGFVPNNSYMDSPSTARD